MSNQPIVIKSGTFKCTLYDVGNLAELTTANLRMLWRIMFDAAYDNTDALAAIRDWLPRAVEQANADLVAQKAVLEKERALAEIARRRSSFMGAAITKEEKVKLRAALGGVKSADTNVKTATGTYKRIQRMQTLFTEMAAKADI